METYLILKHSHMGLAFVSITLFVLRASLMLVGSPLREMRLLRIVPHIIDTLLLATAIALAVLMHYDPMQLPWLMAKIVAVLVYILLGSLALKRGRSRGTRLGALVGSLLLLGYIVAVAFTKLAWPF
jgi:uncharacterized membrane protein SirB2